MTCLSSRLNPDGLPRTLRELWKVREAHRSVSSRKFLCTRVIFRVGPGWALSHANGAWFRLTRQDRFSKVAEL
jgi:hypothetical protein